MMKKRHHHSHSRRAHQTHRSDPHDLPNASLRRLLHALFVQSHQAVRDFLSLQAALPLLQTTSVVVTVLSLDAEPEMQRLLGPCVLPITPRYLQLSPLFVAQLARVQQRFTTLLEQAQRLPPLVTRTDLTSDQWAAIVPFLPPPAPVGRPPVDAQQTLKGILFIVRTGTAWRRMPKHYGSYVTCWRRWRQWQHDGTWPRILEVLAR